MKKSKLYTRSGDNGSTSLVGGERVPKNSVRLEAYGTVDELNSWIGLVAVDLGHYDSSLPYVGLFNTIGSKLFDIGGYLATDPAGKFAGYTADPISADDIALLENAIDLIDSQLPKLNSFVIPGGTTESAHAHIARTVCRRAERRILSLAAEVEVDACVLKYVNRLSDLLFAVARFFVIISGKSEIFWSNNC